MFVRPWQGFLFKLEGIAKVDAVNHLCIKAIIRFGLSFHQTTQPYPLNFKTGQKPASLSGVFPLGCDFDGIFSYIIKGLNGK